MPQNAAGKPLAGRDRRGCAQAVQGGARRAGAPRGNRRRNRAPGERPAGDRAADRYGGLPPADPRHAPAGRVCRHDVFRRQIVVGRLGIGADRGGTDRPAGYSPPCRCRHDGLCRDASRLCPPQARAAGMGSRPASSGWISFQHYTARPAVDIERRDREGRAYTDIREVPLQTADPQLHTHVTVFNSVLTDSGHIGAVDLDRLAGRVKELGAVYHANVAARARQLGIETVLDERTGAARLADIPHSVRELFSKRTIEAQEAAREFAASKGHRLGRDHRRAEDCLVEGRGGRNPPGKNRDGGGPGTEKRFCGMARAGRGGLLPASQRAAAGSGRGRTGCRTAPRGRLSRGPAIARRGARPPCRIGRPGIARDRGTGIDRRRHRRAAGRRHRRRDQKLPRAGRGAGRPAGGAAVGQGGTAARQGALERDDGAAYRPGTRVDPAGQDCLARFVGRSAGGADRPRRRCVPRAQPGDRSGRRAMAGPAGDDDQARHRRPAGCRDRRRRRRQEHRPRPAGGGLESRRARGVRHHPGLAPGGRSASRPASPSAPRSRPF